MLVLMVGSATLFAPFPVSASEAPSAPGGYVTRSGVDFYLNGARFQFVGINAPQAATDYDVNPGCGAVVDLPALFNSLPPDSAVRVGFLQDATINHITGKRDWRGLDRVVAAAEQSPKHPRLIVGLTSQSGTCDANVWKGATWYEGGYRRPANDWDDLPRSSYWQYLQQVVTRYSHSTAIAMWEPVGEPEPSDCSPGFEGAACYGHTTCPPNATAILRAFYDTVGAEIRSLDPNHLIGDGAIGGTQCGWANGGATTIDASPYIDALGWHDYYGATAPPVTPDLLARIATGRLLGKPVITEEAGMPAGTASGCMNTSTRAQVLGEEMRQGDAAGLQGFLPWAYGGPPQPERHACDDYIFSDDPLYSAL